MSSQADTRTSGRAAWTASEMMAIAAARALPGGATCLVGIGLPSTAANLARRLHEDGLVLVYESGTIGAKPEYLPLSIGDGTLAETADTVVSLVEIFNYWLQPGRIDVGFLGAAQVDRFANINTTVIGTLRRAVRPAARCGRSTGNRGLVCGGDHRRPPDPRAVRGAARLRHLARPRLGWRRAPPPWAQRGWADGCHHRSGSARAGSRDPRARAHPRAPGRHTRRRAGCDRLGAAVGADRRDDGAADGDELRLLRALEGARPGATR